VDNAVLGAGTNSDSVFTLRSTAASSSFLCPRIVGELGLQFRYRLVNLSTAALSSVSDPDKVVEFRTKTISPGTGWGISFCAAFICEMTISSWRVECCVFERTLLGGRNMCFARFRCPDK